jgi:hypothetical protein
MPRSIHIVISVRMMTKSATTGIFVLNAVVNTLVYASFQHSRLLVRIEVIRFSALKVTTFSVQPCGKVM